MGNNFNRKAEIENFTKKGVDWCAEKLYEARRNNKKAIEDMRRSIKLMEVDKEHVGDLLLREANRNMAKLLGENGIKPTKLIVTYIDKRCDDCECDECDDCEYEYLDEEESHAIEAVLSVAFYDFWTDGSTLHGISATFEDLEFQNLLKVIYAKTGEVIFEREKDNE